jgi:hypothetical protein
LTLNGSHQVKPQKILPTENVVVKAETLDNGILKTTYSSGVLIYVIPQSLVPNSSAKSILSCGTLPSNAIGCCCMNYGGYQVISLGNNIFVSGFLYTNINFYRFTDPATFQFHLKVSAINDPNYILVDGFFNGFEQPQSASCSSPGTSLLVEIPNPSGCEVSVNVDAERSYKLQGATTFTTCVTNHATDDFIPVYHTNPPCYYAGDDR